MTPASPRLLSALPAEGLGHRLMLAPGEHLPGDLLLRIGEEQLRVVRIDGDGLPVSGGAALAENSSSFVLMERGLEGTEAAAHAAGTAAERLDRGREGPWPASREAALIERQVTPFALTIGAVWILSWAALAWALFSPPAPTATGGWKGWLHRWLAPLLIVAMAAMLVGFTVAHERAAESLAAAAARPRPDPEDRSLAERMADPAGWPLVVQVVGQRYRWAFRYCGRDGRFGSADDVVTARPRAIRGRKLLFQMRSVDVIHALYLPHHGVKRDLLPGRTVLAWCLPERAGRFPIVCSELCGANHSWMRAELLVLEEEAFLAWHAERSEEAVYEHLGADPSAEDFDPDELDPLPRKEWFGGAEGGVWAWWDRGGHRR